MHGGYRCAGFRSGWESAAYVGDTPPAAFDESEPGKEAGDGELTLPGLKLQVRIDNQLRIYDIQIFFGLPLSVDPRQIYPKNHQPGKPRIFVSVTPGTAAFVFRPLLASLIIGGKLHQATRGYQFGMWDTRGSWVAGRKRREMGASRRRHRARACQSGSSLFAVAEL